MNGEDQQPKQATVDDELRRVPLDARLIITSSTGNETVSLPIGKICKDALEALRAARSEREFIRRQLLSKGKPWDTQPA